MGNLRHQEESSPEIDTAQVEAHLDTKDPCRPLTRLEKLNCVVDQGAKEYLQYILATGKKTFEILYGTQWRMTIDGVAVNKKIKEKIYKA